MNELGLPKNWDDLTDAELGKVSLDLFIADQAKHPKLPADAIDNEEFRTLVINYVLTQEADSAIDASIEKALHKAAVGDFETAGRFLRQHIKRGAIEHKFVPIGINMSKQAADFGRRGAELNALKGQANRQKVYEAAIEILKNCHKKPSDRQLARDIARKINMKEGTVRGHLKWLRKEGKLD